MNRKKVFISFDYDNDSFLKDALVGQSRNEDSPFEISDYSIKEASNTWITDARNRIKRCDAVIVICGTSTHTATGVAKELKISQEEGIPYFLLWGYSGKACTKPTTAFYEDKIYKWTWDNLKLLLEGRR